VATLEGIDVNVSACGDRGQGRSQAIVMTLKSSMRHKVCAI
jgi:hypothetical protein